MTEVFKAAILFLGRNEPPTEKKKVESHQMKISFDTLLSMALKGNALAAEVIAMFIAAAANGQEMEAFLGARSNNQITVRYLPV